MARRDDIEANEALAPGCLIVLAGAVVGAIVGLAVGIIDTYGEDDTFGFNGVVRMVFLTGGAIVGVAAFLVGFGVWRLSRRLRRSRSRASGDQRSREAAP
jgi:hypothetical protein